MTTTSREDIVQGLRDLADFIEQHPALPAPGWAQSSIFPRYNVTADDALAIIREMAPAGLGAGATGLEIVRTFAGGVKLSMRVPDSLITQPEPTTPNVAPELLAALGEANAATVA